MEERVKLIKKINSNIEKIALVYERKIMLITLKIMDSLGINGETINIKEYNNINILLWEKLWEKVFNKEKINEKTKIEIMYKDINFLFLLETLEKIDK